jgi:hypothetical protein
MDLRADARSSGVIRHLLAGIALWKEQWRRLTPENSSLPPSIQSPVPAGETCRLQKRSIFNSLVEAEAAHFDGQSALSLLSAQ